MVCGPVAACICEQGGAVASAFVLVWDGGCKYL